ncbi:MAG: CBS domain-containing protein [archaeon]
MTTVAEVMSRNVYTTTKETSVVKAVKEMEKHQLSCVIIVSETEALGIVTSTDLMYKVIAKDKKPNATTVGEIMSSPLVVTTPETTLQDAAKLMAEYKIKKLPVVNGTELVGILTEVELILNGPEFQDVLVNLNLPNSENTQMSS